MRSGAPWHIKGIHPDARDNAREAARRAGMSVGQWLNTVILDSTLDDADEDDYYDDAYAPPALRRRPRQEPKYEARPDRGPDLTVIADRIDGLTEEVERLARISATPREAPPQDDATARKLADALAKLDHRVETFIEEGRTATEALGQKVESVDRALSALGRDRFQAGASDWVEAASTGDWAASVDQACDEIAQRQRELEDEVFSPSINPGRAAAIRAREDFNAIYDRLKQVSDQVEAFGAAKMREAIDSLRNDLAEIAGRLTEASPRRAIEALEREVRLLGSRVDAEIRTGERSPELSVIEAGLAEVRDAIRGLTPAESLSGAVDAIRVLSQKIDQMASGAQDPGGLQQLEAAVAGLRGIVSKVATDDSLAALTAEVRALSGRVAAGLDNSGGADILRNLEQRIGTIADAIETVRVSTASAGSSALENAVRSLADKIDRLQVMPEQPSMGPDIGALFGTLSDKIDRLQTAPEPSSLGADLGAMIGSLGDRIDRIQTAPPQVNTDHLGAMIGALNDKIESLRAVRGDTAVLRQIEERIGKLSEKLEASEARLGNLDNIEKGMKELLAYLEGLRGSGVPAATVETPPVRSIVHDVILTQESLEAAHGTIGDVVDRLAMIETGMRQTGAPPLAPAAPPETPKPATVVRTALQSPQTPVQRPPQQGGIDDVLAPDHPLEPGSGKPRAGAAQTPGTAASASERVAASKAAAGTPRAAAPEAEPKTSFIVAARRAAQAAAEDDTVLMPRKTPEPATAGDAKRSGGPFGKHIKSIIVGACVVIVAAGAIHLAFSFLNSQRMPGDGPGELQASDPALSQQLMPKPLDPGSAGVLNVAPPSTAGSNSDAGVLPQPPAAPIVTTPLVVPAPPPENSQVPPAPSPGATSSEVTGALVNWAPAVAAASATPDVAPQQGSRAAPLPPAIGSKTLIAAAESGDVNAAYEIATRFADGRGVPLNPESAAIWFERSANGGVVPAIFRLGGLYEKGIGVRKDLNKARELYVAAADRGSAKAMHNLAVLYADGFDGKPDYPTAVQWFRKAGARGVPDSQYNLGVLYARGIGVEQNFGESYRWFALAAQSGDQDAAQKRDDVAKRLDPQTLSAARSAVQNWTPEPQPDEAVSVKTPPGGWDPQTPPAAGKSRPKRV